VEDFLYDIVLSIGLNKLKTTTALEAGRRPGIGYARTCGNLRRKTQSGGTFPARMREGSYETAGFKKYRERSGRGVRELGCFVFLSFCFWPVGVISVQDGGATEYRSFRGTKSASPERVTKCALFKM